MDTAQRLTDDEYELLFSALDAIEVREVQEGFTTALLGAMLSPQDESRQHLRQFKENLEHPSEDARILRDRVTLLRAKLIQMRDAKTVSDWVNE